MRNPTRLLFSYLSPFLILLLAFGTLGNLKARNISSDYENVKDIIAVYPVYSELDPLEVMPEDWLFFHGEILKVKDCFVEFKASNGEKYKIPGSDIMGYSLEDPNSKLEEPLLEIIMNPSENCMAGKMDAKMLHRKTGGNFVGGILFGPFWVIGAALWNVSPEKGRHTYTMSRNKDLFYDPYYLDCYIKEAKIQNVLASLFGWGSWIIFVLVVSTAG